MLGKTRGCIYSPPLIDDCLKDKNANKNKKEKSNVGKKNNDDFDSDNEPNYIYTVDVSSYEVEVYKKIKQLIPEKMHQYFYLYDACEKIPNGRIIYRFISCDVDNANNNDDMDTFGRFFYNGSSISCEFIHSFVYSFIHICDAVDVLKEINIIHGNIDLFSNVFVRHQWFPIISGFCTLEEIMARPYEPSNIIVPLELNLIRYMKQNKLQSISEQNIEDIVCDIYINHPLFEAIESGENAFMARQYLSNYINENYASIEKMVKSGAHTWDIYAICMCFFKLLCDCQKMGKIPSNFKKHLELCNALFDEYTHVDATLRGKIDGALAPQVWMKKIFCMPR